MHQRPLAVHRDRKVYLFEALDPQGQLGQQLTVFSDLIKAPEGVYTFDLSPYALWSAAARKISADYIIGILEKNSINHVPRELKEAIARNITEFGILELSRQGDVLILKAKSPGIIDRIKGNKKIHDLITYEPDQCTLHFSAKHRTELKKLLFDMELFAKDSANVLGESLDLNLRSHTLEGVPFSLRYYQIEAADAFLQYKDNAGGGGVIIMPPGTGKTLTGLKIIAALKKTTLIVVDKPAGAKRWKKEFEEKTDLAEENVEVVGSSTSRIKPVTIVTYQRLISNSGISEKIIERDWGLVIYDDAHKLPANTYAKTADIPSQFKLALASTLARSDNNGNQVFSLIGPKWYEILPRTLEQQKFLKPVTCVEVKVPLGEKEKEQYDAEQNVHAKWKIASFNTRKNEALSKLLVWTKNVLIVSFWRDLAHSLGKEYRIPVVCSTVKLDEKLIKDFNEGNAPRLICTSVVESLPVKNVEFLIAVSFYRGSEREEYLRLGKIISADTSIAKGVFYSLVSAGTIEETDYSYRRKKLINYGYRYRIIHLSELLEGGDHVEAGRMFGSSG